MAKTFIFWDGRGGTPPIKPAMPGSTHRKSTRSYSMMVLESRATVEAPVRVRYRTFL
jgi:hypothetical protein